MHVLIIDDNELLRDTMRRAFEAAGHTASLARNGEEGVEALAARLPDVVVTDIIMPEREGVETIIAIRQAHPALPIVAISGGGRMTAMSLLDLAAKFGADATLQKPFRPKELIALAEDLAAKS